MSAPLHRGQRAQQPGGCWGEEGLGEDLRGGCWQRLLRSHPLLPPGPSLNTKRSPELRAHGPGSSQRRPQELGQPEAATSMMSDERDGSLTVRGPA